MPKLLIENDFAILLSIILFNRRHYYIGYSVDSPGIAAIIGVFHKTFFYLIR